MVVLELRELFSNYEDYINKEILIKGWVKTVRDMKKFGFIELNDGTSFDNIQIVFDNKLENFERIKNLNVGASIKVKGKLVESPGGGQAVEIQSSNIEIIGESSPDFPVQKKKHTFEFLREIAHLRPKTNTFHAVFKIRSLLEYAVHNFFHGEGFIQVDTPIITGSDCEGAGEMFRVTTLDLNSVPKTEEGKVDFSKDFFSKETNLTVSGQLEIETFAQAFRKVYNFCPAFRAENSNTPRHLSELWMIEPEVAFADLSDIMDLAEAMLKSIFKYIIDNGKSELDYLNKKAGYDIIKRLNKIINSDFERITYTKAIKLLEDADTDFEYDVKWGIDLQTEHERYITEEIYNKPVFVTDYPKDIKAFYMKLNDDKKTVAATDLLVPGVGELVGGSQREEQYKVLVDRIKEMGLDVEDYWWYLDLRKFGTTPHSGFGLGFERAVMYATGMENIRDVIPFPRVRRNAEF